MDDFIHVLYNDTDYVIRKQDSLRNLLDHSELLSLPLSVWKTIFEQKDGKCYLNIMVQVLIALIKAYDSSPNVNSFYYNGKTYWFDKATRVGLQNLVNSSTEPIQLVLGDEIVELELDKAKKFLSDLEVYAGKCYINTNKHLIAIKQIKTLEDVINYDYTIGYPDKITLS